MNICRRAFSTRTPSHVLTKAQQPTREAQTTKKVHTIGDQLLAQGARGRPDATGTAQLIELGSTVTVVISASEKTKQKKD